MTSRKQKKKHTFILKDINPILIDEKYGIQSKLESNTIPQKSTKISELQPFSSRTSITNFLDDNNVVSMFDSISRKRLFGTICFWCRLSFTDEPIGCPIQYVPAKTTKVCVSETTKEKYVLHQTIPSYESDKGYYQTDGIFCSFNCCLSFIRDQKHNPFYTHSEELLYQIYKKVFPHIKTKIQPAPSWRLLTDYGGYMNHEEFRNSFNTHIYIDKHQQLNTIPNIQPIGHIFEQHYIF